MLSNEIIFEESDSLQKIATKTVQIYAGSNELKNQMQKLGVKYTKVERGAFVVYVLRHREFGRVEVKL